MLGFKKKKSVVVLKRTRKGECGGTDATLDKSAPKTIVSEEMTLFDVTSALHGDGALGYVSAFAAPAGEGTFLFLETGESFQRRAEKSASWALVKADVFPALARLARECELAKQNGYHSKTHGLPENFGGSVRIEYKSGERISYSDNQTPILTLEEGEKIASLFREAMAGEKVALPDAGSLVEIRFAEERENGAFTHAHLTINADGTATNKKSSRFDDPTVYESEKDVDAKSVAAIRRSIADTGLLAWAALPANGYGFSADKSLTFVFANGSEITVRDDRLVPDQLRRGFFNVELEMTTKN